MQGGQKYISVKEGNYPIIITCPHDGYLRNSEFSTRTAGKFRSINLHVLGVTVRDIHTSFLANELIQAFGPSRKPYIINLNVCRTKLDVNRELDFETSACNDLSTQVHNAYHAAINNAIDTLLLKYPFVFILDLHGQGHRKNCAELGYLLNSNALSHLNRQANGNMIQKWYAENYLGEQSSLRHAKNFLKSNREMDLSELIWGENSFGSLLSERGFECLPSAKLPVIPLKNKKKAKFFSGGYTIKRHCLRSTKPVLGLQIELPSDWRGQFPANRKKMFIKPKASTLKSLAGAMKESLDLFFKMNLKEF